MSTATISIALSLLGSICSAESDIAKGGHISAPSTQRLAIPSTVQLSTEFSYTFDEPTPGLAFRGYEFDVNTLFPLSSECAVGLRLPFATTTFGSTVTYLGEPRVLASYFPERNSTTVLGLDIALGFPTLSRAPSYLNDNARFALTAQVSALWDFSPLLPYLKAGGEYRNQSTDHEFYPLIEAGAFFKVTPSLTALVGTEWGLSSAYSPYIATGVSRSDAANVRLGITYLPDSPYFVSFDTRIGITAASPNVTYSISIGRSF